MTSDIEGYELMKAFGIPLDDCSKVVITIEADKDISIVATYSADSDKEEFSNVLKTFRVISLDETTANEEI